MKVYRPGESVAPIVVNLFTSEESASAAWFGAALLFGFGILLWLIPGNRSNLTFSSGCTMAGFSLALMLAGISTISPRIPALARFGTRHRIAVYIAVVTVVVLTFGPVALNALIPGQRPLGMIFVLGFFINFAVVPLWIVQRRNARRIAAEMHEAVRIGAAMTKPPGPEGVAPANPGELVIEIYEPRDLPPSPPLRPITPGANIAGQPPCRFLHLYNFFANAISAQTRPLSGWRLHGPVAMLASPLELARAAGYKVDLAQAVAPKLLSDQAKIEARVAAIPDAPLPPSPPTAIRRWIARWLNKIGRRPRAALPLAFADFGAYSEDVLMCTDQTWQIGVEALTVRAAKVVMDASDFSAERRGLIWEIQHVLNRFATRDFVVIVNSFTDLPALADAFRTAWQTMTATSPNNHSGESRLRFVLLIGDDRGGFDSDNVLGARSEEIRAAERIDAHHRIVALLRDGESSS